MKKRGRTLYVPGEILFFMAALLIFLGMPTPKWKYELLWLPWLSLLILPGLWGGAIRVAKDHVISLGATFGLCLGIYISNRLNGGDRGEIRGLLAFTLWWPSAAFVQSLSDDDVRCRRLKLFFMAICASIWISSSALVWQYYFIPIARPLGVSHNVLVGPMLLSLGLLLGLTYLAMQGWRSPVWRSLLWISWLMALLGAYYTGARIALICFAIVWCGLMLLPGRRFLRAIVGLVLIASWGILSLGHSLEFGTNIRQYEAGNHKTSIGARMDAWRWSAEHWGDHPWFGRSRSVLTVDFDRRGKEWGIPEDEKYFEPHLHNDLLQVVMAYGIPTAVMFSIWWIFIVRKIGAAVWLADMKVDRLDGRKAQSLIGLIMVMNFGVASMVDSFVFNTEVLAMMMVCMGGALGLVIPLKNQHSEN